MFERRNHSITSGSVNDGAVLTLASGTVISDASAVYLGTMVNAAVQPSFIMTGGQLQGSTALYCRDGRAVIRSGTLNGSAQDIDYWGGTVDLRGYGDPAGLVLKNSASEAIALTDGNIKLPTGYAFYPQDVSTPAESLASSAAYTVGACTHRNNAYGFCEVCQVSITGASISVGTDLTIIITRRCMMPPW